MVRKIAALAVVLLVSGCAEFHRTDQADVRVFGNTGTIHVFVIKDPVAPVTCWATWNAMACLPNKAVEAK